MSRTVNRNQTLEEFRNTYNNLASDIGSLTGLAGTISNSNTLVDAINEVENKTFFFQTFEYVSTASQTTFTSTDRNGNSLSMRPGRFQVFLNKSSSAEHLVEGDDYNIASPDGQGNFNAIQLNVAASSGDVLTVYTFTGSALGTGAAAGGGGTGQFTETAANTIYNINSNGVILNGDSSSRTTTLESGYTLQLAGKTFAEDDIVSTVSGKKVQFPIISDGTAQFTGGVGTGFSSITSTSFVGNISGNVTGDVTGDVKHGGSVVLDASTGALTGTVSSITNHQITDLSDVDTTAPSNGQILVYNSSSSKYVPTDQQTSDTVTEGSSNLYFTDARVSTRVDTILNHSNHSNLTVSKVGDELRFSASAQYGDSDVQSYLSGGAGLTMSGAGSFSVNTSNGVKIDGDDVELDYEVVSSAPSGVGSTSVGHLWFVI
jgi:hypothetical protein